MTILTDSLTNYVLKGKCQDKKYFYQGQGGQEKALETKAKTLVDVYYYSRPKRTVLVFYFLKEWSILVTLPFIQLYNTDVFAYIVYDTQQF